MNKNGVLISLVCEIISIISFIYSYTKILEYESTFVFSNLEYLTGLI